MHGSRVIFAAQTLCKIIRKASHKKKMAKSNGTNSTLHYTAQLSVYSCAFAFIGFTFLPLVEMCALNIVKRWQFKNYVQLFSFQQQPMGQQWLYAKQWAQAYTTLSSGQIALFEMEKQQTVAMHRPRSNFAQLPLPAAVKEKLTANAAKG